MSYLKNVWYVGAWDKEVGSKTLLNRTICDSPILFFRNESGEMQAIHNRCPHRFAPLSNGKHMGNTVQCQYHGLEFNGSGSCTSNPHGNIPRAACVRSYPVIEKWSLVWVWLGDPNQADEGLIPDFSCLDPEQFYVAQRYLNAKANYELETDNI